MPKLSESYLNLRKITHQSVIQLIIDEGFASERAALGHILLKAKINKIKTGFSEQPKKAYEQYKKYKYK